MGKMRCLHALGEWEQLSKLAQERWANSTYDIKRAVAPLAAAAAWGLGEWERMDTYISVMKSESPDRSFLMLFFLFIVVITMMHQNKLLLPGIYLQRN